jgi:hypothetical protein
MDPDTPFCNSMEFQANLLPHASTTTGSQRSQKNGPPVKREQDHLPITQEQPYPVQCSPTHRVNSNAHIPELTARVTDRNRS